LQERLVLADVRHREWEVTKRREITDHKLLRHQQTARKLEDIEREREERRRRREHGRGGSTATNAPTIPHSRAASVSDSGGDNAKMVAAKDPMLKGLWEKVQAKKAARMSQRKASAAPPPPLSKQRTGPTSKPAALENRWAELDAAEREHERRREAMYRQLDEVERSVSSSVSSAVAEPITADERKSVARKSRVVTLETGRAVPLPLSPDGSSGSD
ncbi:hypothetical protein BDK51DRAFT_33149, partial [Blyttiomyces helicus]